MEYLAYIAVPWCVPVILLPIAGAEWDEYVVSQNGMRRPIDDEEIREYSQQLPILPAIIAKLKMNARKGRENWSKSKDKDKGKERQVALQQGIELERMPLVGRKGKERGDGVKNGMVKVKEREAGTSGADRVHGKVRRRDRYLSWISRYGSVDGEDDDSERPRRREYEGLPNGLRI